MKTVKGFTLIELMIVVVIVAILAAVAIPSYQNSIQKTRRADAKETLTRIAAAQERYFFTNNNYAADLTKLGLNATGDSTEGHYTITLGTPENHKSGMILCETSGSSGSSSSQYPCFRLNATAKLTGSQAKDTHCKTFTINHTGKKSATSSDCW